MLWGISWQEVVFEYGKLWGLMVEQKCLQKGAKNVTKRPEDKEIAESGSSI